MTVVNEKFKLRFSGFVVIRSWIFNLITAESTPFLHALKEKIEERYGCWYGEDINANTFFSRFIQDHAFLFPDQKESVMSKANERPSDENLRDRMRGFNDLELEAKIQHLRSRSKSRKSHYQDILVKVDGKITGINNEKSPKHHYYTVQKEFAEVALRRANEELDETSLINSAIRMLISSGRSFNLPYVGFVDLFPLLDLTDYDLDNPFRHFQQLSFPVYQEMQSTWKSTKDSGQTLAVIQQEIPDIESRFQHLIQDPCFAARRLLFQECLDVAGQGFHSAATLLLITQLEGLLVDWAQELNGITFDGNTFDIFPIPVNTDKFIKITGGLGKNLSIAKLIQQSRFRCAFDPAYTEFFLSEFYDNRCQMAHGAIVAPSNHTDFLATLLFAITTVLEYEKFKNDLDWWSRYHIQKTKCFNIP
ncbi:MAG: hypothetical protein HQL72_01150 [Magnetococcales bacterium]|nr:hypothetical protein [Magnetococcales bacterium]